MRQQGFVTTQRGLNRHLPVMKLYEKAKRFGIWNPSEIDLNQYKKDWAALSPQEQDLLTRLTAMFQTGEEDG